MAKSLKFYRSYCPALKDSTATEDFCLKINEAFDSLNLKQLNKGMSPNSYDYKVNILNFENSKYLKK